MKDYAKFLITSITTAVVVLAASSAHDSYSKYKANKEEIAKFKVEFHDTCVDRSKDEVYCSCLTDIQMSKVDKANMKDFKSEVETRTPELLLTRSEKNSCVKLDAEVYANLKAAAVKLCTDQGGDQFTCSCVVDISMNNLKALHLKTMDDVYQNIDHVAQPTEEEAAACVHSDQDL
jgi:hypothetical protein